MVVSVRPYRFADAEAAVGLRVCTEYRFCYSVKAPYTAPGDFHGWIRHVAH